MMCYGTLVLPEQTSREEAKRACERLQLTERSVHVSLSVFFNLRVELFQNTGIFFFAFRMMGILHSQLPLAEVRVIAHVGEADKVQEPRVHIGETSGKFERPGHGRYAKEFRSVHKRIPTGTQKNSDRYANEYRPVCK